MNVEDLFGENGWVPRPRNVTKNEDGTYTVPLDVLFPR